MSRARKPTALKLLEGDRGKGRRPVDVTREPWPDPLPTDCPAELDGDAVAIAEWHRGIVPAIHRRQVTEADRHSAIAHCKLWSLWLAQMREADAEPHVLKGNTRIMANPKREMAHKTFDKLLRTEVELGFTPVSRSKVQVPRREDHDAPQAKWAGIL